MIVKIEFKNIDEYAQKLSQKDNPDLWIDLAINIDGSYIYGSEESGVRGYACSIVLQLLRSIKKLTIEDRHVIEFEYGPTWLVVEPLSDDEIRVARSSIKRGIENPGERLEIDTAVRTTSKEWERGVVDAADRFVQIVKKQNVEAASTKTIQEIENLIQQSRES